MLVLSSANELDALSFEETWDVFFYAAKKYWQEYKKIPVLIIDNANKFAQEELEEVQDLAKSATDEGTATVVFVSSEGHVPRRMMGKQFMLEPYLFVNDYTSLLTEYYREKLMVKTWKDRRNF